MSVQTTHAETEKTSPLTPEQKHEQRQLLLTRSTPALVGSIADAIVIKNQNLFFLSAPDGNVPLDDAHGLGLYYHDCRYLKGYELKLNDVEPVTLVANAGYGFMSVFELTNPDLTVNGQLVPKDSLGIRWQRTLDWQRLALDDLFTLHNYGIAPVDFSLALTFQAHFEDIFEVRGLLPKKIGRFSPPQWENGNLRFVYEGADGL